MMARRFAHLSDFELAVAAEVMRDKAHMAPKALSGDDDNPAVNSLADAYARFAREWCDLIAEINFRGNIHDNETGGRVRSDGPGVESRRRPDPRG